MYNIRESGDSAWKFGSALGIRRAFAVIAGSRLACCRVLTSSLGFCRSHSGSQRPGRYSGAGLVHAQVDRIYGTSRGSDIANFRAPRGCVRDVLIRPLRRCRDVATGSGICLGGLQVPRVVVCAVHPGCSLCTRNSLVWARSSCDHMRCSSQRCNNSLRSSGIVMRLVACSCTAHPLFRVWHRVR